MRFIGVFDYTVILTYASLVSAVFGMTQAIHGDYKTAIICLAISGICDSFDGRVARTKKNRTKDEKAFGIQLDSLCDVVCFGVFPAVICYLLGVRGLLGIILVSFYCVCAVMRLAFFNVLEEKRQRTEEGSNKTYRGLPVTSVAIILPLTFWLQFIMSDFAFLVLLHAVITLLGFLFILDFSMRKPGLKTLLLLIALGILTVSIIYVYTKFRVPGPGDETNQIIEEIKDELYETEIP